MDTTQTLRGLSTPLLSSETREKTQQQPSDDCVEGEVTSQSCWDNIILWIILPILIFIQFGISFSVQKETPHSLQWSTVNWSIVLFCVASYIFRRAIDDVTRWLSLLPEIIMDVLLAMVLCGAVELAFLTMVTSTIVLSLYVVVHSIHTLWQHGQDDDESEKEDVIMVNL